MVGSRASRAGISLGAINHKYKSPIAPAMMAGGAKSNMPNCVSPRSAAIATTSRLVEVPIVVDIPPIEVAKPSGINNSDAGVAVFSDTLISIGNSRITIGVLLTKALSMAAITSVARKDNTGLTDHNRASSRPTGSSAPVRTSAWPAIIKEQTAISAWCPNPVSKCEALSGPSSPVNGINSKNNDRLTKINRLVEASGILSLAKKNQRYSYQNHNDNSVKSRFCNCDY